MKELFAGKQVTAPDFDIIDASTAPARRVVDRLGRHT